MTTEGDYLALVDSLVRAGVGRDAAEKEARRRIPEVEPSPKDSREREKRTQWRVVKRFRAFSFRVYTTSQARPSKMGLGIPDLWCMHELLPIALWWESKRPVGGKFSDEQVGFARDCERCRVGYGSGDANDAEECLVGLGLAERIGGYLEPSAMLKGARTAARLRGDSA